MKRYFIILFLSIFIVLGCSVDEMREKIKNNIDQYSTDEVSIMEFGNYRNFSVDNVKSLKILKYTEAGVNEEKVDDINQIKREVNAISKIKVGSETDRACDDNTTIYEFIMNDSSKVSFEFECDWLVVGNKRYNIERNK